MDKLNIENLFHCKTRSQSAKTLDIEAITQKKKSFDIDVLIETREKKRENLLNCYVKFYENCLRKIEIANNLGKTDLLYSVSEFVPNCPEYKAEDCIEYIKKKLEKKLFDTCIVENKTLFITWIYLEINKEKNNETK